MKNNLKRFTAIVMTLVMMATMMPTTGLATGSTIGPFGATPTPKITFTFVDETGGDYLGINNQVELPAVSQNADSTVYLNNLVNWAEIRNNFKIPALDAKLNECYTDTMSFKVVKKGTNESVYLEGDQYNRIFHMPDCDVEVLCLIERTTYEFSYNYNGYDMYDNKPQGNHSVVDTTNGQMRLSGGNFKLRAKSMYGACPT